MENLPQEIQIAFVGLVSAALAVVGSLARALVMVFGEWLKSKVAGLKVQIGERNFGLLEDQLRIFIKGAEQLGQLGIVKDGEDKLKVVLEEGSAIAKRLGIEISPMELRLRIEALIHEGWNLAIVSDDEDDGADDSDDDGDGDEPTPNNPTGPSGGLHYQHEPRQYQITIGRSLDELALNSPKSLFSLGFDGQSRNFFSKN